MVNERPIKPENVGTDIFEHLLGFESLSHIKISPKCVSPDCVMPAVGHYCAEHALEIDQAIEDALYHRECPHKHVSVEILNKKITAFCNDCVSDVTYELGYSEDDTNEYEPSVEDFRQLDYE